MESIEKPCLTEPGVKYFLNGVLKNCKEKRSYFENTIFNLVALGLFIIIIGGILYYKYKGKLTPEEKKRKNNRDKEEILKQLNTLNIKVNKNNKYGNTNLITDLPLYDNSSQLIKNPLYI